MFNVKSPLSLKAQFIIYGKSISQSSILCWFPSPIHMGSIMKTRCYLPMQRAALQETSPEIRKLIFGCW